MKMLKKTYHILLSLMSAALLLPSLTACNAVVDGEEVERVENVNYINLTLYVSSGETVTRAPNGGEDGDARSRDVQSADEGDRKGNEGRLDTLHG